MLMCMENKAGFLNTSILLLQHPKIKTLKVKNNNYLVTTKLYHELAELVVNVGVQ